MKVFRLYSSLVFFLIVFSLLLFHCGTPDSGLKANKNDKTSKTDEAGNMITVLDKGDWTSLCGCSGFCVYQHNFWVDLLVKNDSYDKSAGIVWTENNWETERTAFANYEREYSGNFEIWGVDVHLPCNTISDTPPDFQFRSFVTMNNNTSWDENGHYHIRDQTIELIGSQFVLSPCTDPLLPNSPDKTVCGADMIIEAVVDPGLGKLEEVFVHWTRDDWQTVHDTRLTTEESSLGGKSFQAIVDLRTQEEIEQQSFEKPNQVIFKLYAVISGEEVWESSENHTLF